MVTNQVNVHQLDLTNIEVRYGVARYRTCPNCGAKLHRYVRETYHTHAMYCRCVECGAHYGYAGEEHEQIVRQLRDADMGEVAAFLPLVIGPVTLDDDPTRELGGYGHAAD